MNTNDLDRLCINTLRFLAVDAVQAADSGHPGAPLGAAPMAYVLWDRFLRHNPADPAWPDRDRFVLSAGHASAMLYALLHLTGYDLPLDEIKRFRQWGSKTPGHPEYHLTPGVETTTGPLGQGFGNAVGMAIAERWLAHLFNREGFTLFDHHTYVIASDGDMMEGVASEAASLAGTLGLNRLVVLYDANNVSIEGSTSLAFHENVAQRFMAYGWNVLGPIDGMDPGAAEAAIASARQEPQRPSLIVCHTVIGYGSPNKAGKAVSHGEPLGEEEVRLTKERLGWKYQEPFTLPEEALAHFRKALARGGEAEAKWKATLEAYRQKYPREAASLHAVLNGSLPEGWNAGVAGLYKGKQKPVSTRVAGGKVLNAIAPHVPALHGGSADLAPSTKTSVEAPQGRSPDGAGLLYDPNMHFGVREHAMGAICNGMALHYLIPYAATFLIFSDYMRPPMRLAAFMGQRVIYVLTHDSIGLGQDGPTHQPVEQLAGLRAVPNMVVMRPADATETAVAWEVALERRNGPTCLVLTRQDLPVLDREALAPADGARRGAYVLWETSPKPDVILIATGSEVHVALEAAKRLQGSGTSVRVVSMPSWELFDAQPKEYRESVLPPGIKARVSVEALSPMGWERYVGPEGVIIGLDHFGASAPGGVLFEQFGFTPERVAEAAARLVPGRSTR